MNVLFLSPAYPPSFAAFVRALHERGASVFGVGDVPGPALSSELAGALSDYVYVRDLSAYDDVLRAVAGLVHRHGRLDHVDSLNEHWLPLEARLREDFNVPGVRPEATRRFRSKLSMAQVFTAAGLAQPASAYVRNVDDVTAFAARHGYPLLVKPDVGVGATQTYKLADAGALEHVPRAAWGGLVVQPFVTGDVVSFDGLCDRDGNVLFESAFVYCAGVLETVSEKRDVWMATRRTIPEGLREVGTAMVRAFDTRARFFHCELFQLADGTFIPLEINLRPPGGYAIDLMNYTCDIDVARLWAAIVTQGDFAGFHYERRYHAAHVGRRDRGYRRSTAEIAALLGPALLAVPPVPPGIGDAMGNPIYLVRDEDETRLHQHIAAILEPATAASPG